MNLFGSRSTLARPNSRIFKDFEAVFRTLSYLLSLVGTKQLKCLVTEPLYNAESDLEAASQKDKAGTSQTFPDNNSSNVEAENRGSDLPEKVGRHLTFPQSAWHLQCTTPTFFPRKLLQSVIGPYQQQCIMTWHSHLILKSLQELENQFSESFTTTGAELSTAGTADSVKQQEGESKKHDSILSRMDEEDSLAASNYYNCTMS